MLTFILGILIYSSILTAVVLYKDASSYHEVDGIDLLTAGPVMWVTFTLMEMLRPLIREMESEKTPKDYKVKNKKYIEKIVKEVVDEHKKCSDKTFYFNFEVCENYLDTNYEGWRGLLIPKATNEKLNKKFSDLMWNQKEETLNELNKYCTVLTKEYMTANGYKKDFIKKFAKSELKILN